MAAHEAILPYIGRHGEVALLRRLATAPPAERPAAVTIEGAAGTGKTRLLREALAGGRDDGQVICTCRRLQQAVPFWPLDAAWRAAGGGSDQQGGTAREPAAAVESWAARLAGRAVTGAGLLVLDAAQWADPWTLRALDALLSGAFGAPPLLWVTRRPQEGTAELAMLFEEAEASAGRTRVCLGPLGEAEVCATLAGYVVEGARHVAAWLAAATGGLPDVMVATTGALAADGILEAGPGRWRVHLARLEGAYAGGAVPQSVQQVVRRRLDALAPATREVVELCAVAGGSISPIVLESVCGESVADAVEDLIGMHLLGLVDDEWGTRYTLAFAALGHTALAALSSTRHARLKARLEAL